MALLFYPRGGSSQVVRYLARALQGAGWEAEIVAGSLGPPGRPSNAETFFEGLEVRAVDYTRSVDAADPLAADPPFHPSYEDRPGAPDRVFAQVDEAGFERLTAAWTAELDAAGAADADVLHLHHLTPINEAARRAFPETPVVGHLHGTELLMLAAIDGGPPAGWDHADAWAERMRAWAQGCERLLVLSPDAVRRVPDLLGVEPERVAWAPNGFDPEAFDRRPIRGADRLRLWRHWLVEDPRGWDEAGEEGSIRYSERDLEAFAGEAPVLLYVGRYTEVKRLPLLIRAYARARERFGRRAPLVLLGGYPGEWEGEHPLATVRRTGATDVFLAGWRGHEDLPDGLNAADLTVLPSVREQFGQVIVEGMACGLPAIAVDAHGPATIVDHGETGWLVPAPAPGLLPDPGLFATALRDALRDPARLRARGAAARRRAEECFGSSEWADRLATRYAAVAAGRVPERT